MKVFIISIISLVSLPFLWFGFTELKNTIIEQKNTIKVQGLIVENILQTGAGGSVCNPRVQFTTQKGEKISFVDKIGSYPADFEVGQKVKVLYHPDNPHQALLGSFKRTWLIPCILITVGLIPWILALLILRKLDL